uniref:Uncharacterized protein n=1 Tax=Timema cristinae TaxID=61476 RepID=A0A7R9GWW2_TIMCR|nr:unnamed protein product [Timema cristinae]
MTMLAIPRRSTGAMFLNGWAFLGNINSKTRRYTRAQIVQLVDYMSTHSELASSRFSCPINTEKLDRQWEALAKILEKHGPKKTIAQWKILANTLVVLSPTAEDGEIEVRISVWRDLKCKVRGRLAEVNRVNSAPEKEKSAPSLTELELKVRAIITTVNDIGEPSTCERGLQMTLSEEEPPIDMDISFPLPSKAQYVKYLGSMIETKGGNKEDLIRSGLHKGLFNRCVRDLLWRREVLYRVYFVLIVTHAAASWTLNVREIRKLEDMGMEFLRNILSVMSRNKDEVGENLDPQAGTSVPLEQSDNSPQPSLQVKDISESLGSSFSSSSRKSKKHKEVEERESAVKIFKEIQKDHNSSNKEIANAITRLASVQEELLGQQMSVATILETAVAAHLESNKLQAEANRLQAECNRVQQAHNNKITELLTDLKRIHYTLHSSRAYQRLKNPMTNNGDLPGAIPSQIRPIIHWDISMKMEKPETMWMTKSQESEDIGEIGVNSLSRPDFEPSPSRSNETVTRTGSRKRITPQVAIGQSLLTFSSRLRSAMSDLLGMHRLFYELLAMCEDRSDERCVLYLTCTYPKKHDKNARTIDYKYAESSTVAQSSPEHACIIPTNQYLYHKDCLIGQYNIARVTTTRR